ncbi:WD40 repeat domain-containing protein [Desulfocicer niacini]
MSAIIEVRNPTKTFGRGQAIRAENRSWMGIIMCLFILLIGCDHKPDQDEVSVNSAIFTRTGLFLEMAGSVPIRSITISRDGQTLVSQSLDSPGQALINLKWESGTRYDLKVSTRDGVVNMPVYAPDKPSPVKIADIALEDLDKEEMEYRYYASRGSEVCFSPDGAYIGVGSKGGYVYLVSTASKEILWKHKIPQGRVATVVISNDGKLIAGEESMDGFLYCFDLKTGNLVWQYKTAQDFDNKGSSVIRMRGRYKYYPLQLWGLKIDNDNNPYVMVRHASEKLINEKKTMVTTSMVYRFSIKTGQPVWKYPLKDSAWGLDISEDGKYVIPSMGWAKTATLVVIDGETGKPCWQYEFAGRQEGVESFRGTTGFMARISPDSRHVVVNQMYPDWTFVFDNQASSKNEKPLLLWKKKFLKVLDVSGVPISASSANLKLTNTDLIFATWSTRALGMGAETRCLPARHPDADTLFVYDYEGKLKWKWKLGEGIWNNDCLLSKKGEYMVIPIGLVPETSFANPKDMGVYVFSPNAQGGGTARLNWFYHTPGFAYKAAVSPDGKYIVVIEAPFDVDPDRLKEDIQGSHRLIILS